MLGFWPTVRSGWLPVRTYLLATARVICSRAQPPELPHPTVTPGQGRRQQGQRWRRGPKLNWGCWNVQTLHSYLHVTTAGEVNICGKDPTKIDNLCMELKTHDISLCAISEHRWRGEGQIMVDDDWLFLFSGVDKEAAKAMQGVGFLLNKEMQKAWKDADQLCEYNGGRLLRIRLRIQGRYFSVISCYAPTFRCPDEEKETFYEELGKMLDAVPRKDELVILGDFNARVGLASRDPMEDAPTVHEMVGNHGLPERNDNGVRLLDFCAGRTRSQLRVASTFFQHKEYGTWFHQSSRRWFQIDHVLCSRQTLGLVTDVRVMPGFVHNTDHRFLRVQMAIPPKATLNKFYGAAGKSSSGGRPPRLQVSGFKDDNVARDFNTQLHSLMCEGIFDEGYSLFGRAVRKVAERCLGEVPKQGGPEWKLVYADELARLSQEKRQVALESPDGFISEEYKHKCIEVKKQVRGFINEWWAAKAKEIQERVDSKDHNYQFAGYRELRRVLAFGRKSPGKLRDAKGNLILTRSGRINRWREYFKELLNVSADVKMHQLDRVAKLLPDHSLDSVPGFEETIAAVGRLKAGRAAGPDGIEAEVLCAMDPINLRALHEFFVRVWTGVDVMPAEWKEAFLVPLPKKGDLTQCKRWRGILLASIPGKVFARVMNARLAQYAEANGLLPESQCGFRPGRGTMDMVFALKLAMEIADYKKHPFHVLFVDLVKAYDSVARAGVWAVLRRKGVPPRLIGLIQAYYSGKRARISVEGGLSEEFELETGLGQGCCLAPLLFNIFLAAVVEAWVGESGGGVNWLARIDGALLHREAHDKYASWKPLELHELGYADDAALIADTLVNLHSLAKGFQLHLREWGLELSVEKTEAMSSQAGAHAPIPVEEFGGFDEIKFSEYFEYLGVVIQRHGSGDLAVTERLEKARKAFWALNSSVWSVQQLSLSTKLSVYRACVLSVLLYGAEVWTHTYPVRKKLEKFHMICLRRISGYGLGYQRDHSLSNEDLRAWLGVPSISDLVCQCRLRWLGHVGRMPDYRIPKRVLFGVLPTEVGQARQPGLKAGKRLRDAFAKDLNSAGIDRQGWLQFANSGEGAALWKHKTACVALWHKPLAVVPNAFPPRRTVPVPGKVVNTKKRIGHAHRLLQAVDKISSEFAPGCAFIRMELEAGGRERLVVRIKEEVCTRGDADPDLTLEELCCDMVESMFMEADTEGDLAMFRLLVATVVLSQQGGLAETVVNVHTGVTPRRVSRKQRPPAWYVKRQADAKAILDGTAPPRVRTKYWNLRNISRTTDVEDGEFECDFPGCGRRYTTKGGLSHHKLISHKVGTYRQGGFDCDLCPRSFEREMWLTRHKNYDHALLIPFKCPFCQGLWPGAPSLRMHIAADHRLEEKDFPAPCSLCVQSGQPSDIFKSVHHFKYHLKRFHL